MRNATFDMLLFELGLASPLQNGNILHIHIRQGRLFFSANRLTSSLVALLKEQRRKRRMEWNS